jgi:integrase
MARGDGRIFLKANSSVYSMAFYVHGVEQRETTGERDPDKALKVLHNRIKEVHADELGGPMFVASAAKKMTVRELLDSLKADFTMRDKASPQNLSGIKLAQEAFGDIRAVSFGPKHVDQFIKEKLTDEYANATINRIAGFVEQAFALAVTEGKLPKVPYIKHLSEKDNVRQGFVSKAEFLRVHANLPADLQDFAMFAFSTGWRRGEIVNLDWSNVQDGDTVIRLRPEQTKNGHGRSVPVEGELVDIIKHRREARTIEANGTTTISRFVFHRGDGLRVGDFRKVWAKATAKAKLPRPLLFHDLRRSAVTAMVNAGIPQLVAMGLSGHRTPSMFSRYNISIEDEQRAALKAVEEYHKRKIQASEQKASNVVSMGQG